MRYILPALVMLCMTGCTVAEKVSATYHPDRATDRLEVSLEITLVNKK